MEFLSDKQCCTKCLKKGIRVPYLVDRAKYSNGFDNRRGQGRWNNAMRWCQACWQERYRRTQEQASAVKQKRLRYQEWEARALMSKEERQRTPMVHIPVGRISGPNKGKLRHPLTYLAMYARYRNNAMRRLYGLPVTKYGGNLKKTPPPPPVPDRPQSRHNLLPTS